MPDQPSQRQDKAIMLRRAAALQAAGDVAQHDIAGMVVIFCM